MDGLELLETVKKSDTLRHIPMVMLTARASMEAKLSALQLGVDDYITKPFNEEELLIRIQNLLRNQQERLEFIQEENLSENVDTTKVSDTSSSIQISESDQKWLIDAENLINENLRIEELENHSIPNKYKDWWFDRFYMYNLRFAYESLNAKNTN